MKRKYTLNQNYFNNINNLDKAYWLGFIAADGCIQRKCSGNYLTISLNIKDNHLLERLKNCLIYNGPLYYTKRREVILSVCSNQIVTDIEKIGITEKKSLTLQNIINNIPPIYRDVFITGYFDGDGTVGLYTQLDKRDGRYYTYAKIGLIGTKEFLEGLRNHLGIQGSFFNIIKNKNVYLFSLKKKSDVLLFNKQIIEIYPHSLDRKRIVFRNIISYWGNT